MATWAAHASEVEGRWRGTPDRRARESVRPVAMPQTQVPDHDGADAGNRVRQRGQKGAGWRETTQPGDGESGAASDDEAMPSMIEWRG
jgi:hypothetical protein